MASWNDPPAAGEATTLTAWARLLAELAQLNARLIARKA